VIRFALRNLVRNRARSALALLGLAGSTAGVVLLVAISIGARHMIGDAMDMAKGIIVMKKYAPSPVVSKVPASLDERLGAVSGVSVVVPEVWAYALSVEGRPMLAGGMANVSMLLGTDPRRRHALRQGGLFSRSLVQGRMFTREEQDAVVVSRRLADQFEKKLGSTLNVMDRPLTITGIFDTGTPIFDNMILVQEETVRSVAEIRSSSYSSYYLEIAKGEDVDAVGERVRAVVPAGIEVKSTSDWGREVSTLVGELDPYLAAVAIVAGGIGALGVVNTMLMSVRERVRELGVLRATGWRRRDVFALVLVEAALLGALGGALGSIGGSGAGALAARLLTVRPATPPSLVLASVAGAVLLGALGGLYPAFYAARLDPIAAIRGGA
jgi:putative ABC transport system permease protein